MPPPVVLPATLLPLKRLPCCCLVLILPPRDAPLRGDFDVRPMLGLVVGLGAVVGTFLAPSACCSLDGVWPMPAPDRLRVSRDDT